MKRYIITIALAGCLAAPAFAQESTPQVWTLRACIQHAVDHNLTIKQQEATRDQQAVELNTARWSRLPSLNGNVGQSFNFGRALQADNTYGNINTRQTSFSLYTDVPLFTGMRLPHQTALARLNLQAAVEDLNKAKDDIRLGVAQQYLQVLYTEELATIARQQVTVSRQQLSLKERFEAHGKASEAEVAEARSRVAQDELSATQATNNYQLALLELSQTLELPSPEGMSVAQPKLSVEDIQLPMPEEVFGEAVLSKPQIRAAELRLRGAQESVRIAQSYYYPQLNFGAGLGSSYYNMSGYANTPFSSQWHRNFSKYVSLSLSIPLFNRFQYRNSVRTARIQRSAYSWQLEESRKSLYKEIQQAYYNATAGRSQLESSRTAEEAAAASFRLVSEKYAEGMATATEYNESRTAWMKAVADRAQAKYEYLFRSQILDFYRGKELGSE
jgi:outer membrane protein